MNGIDWLLDTNVVIGLLKGHPAAIDLVQRSGLVLQRAAVSQITRMELLGFPALTADEATAVSAFLGACHVQSIDDRVEAEAIRLRRTGRLELPDAIVLASATALGASLLTLDERLASVAALHSGE